MKALIRHSLPSKLAITMRQIFILAYMTIHIFIEWAPWNWLMEKLTLWRRMTTVVTQWNSKVAKWPLQLSGYKMKSNVQAIWITVFYRVHWALNSSSKGLIVISCDICCQMWGILSGADADSSLLWYDAMSIQSTKHHVREDLYLH
jgi:hypothetical protein